MSWVVSGRVEKTTVCQAEQGRKYTFFHEISVLRTGSVGEFTEGLNPVKREFTDSGLGFALYSWRCASKVQERVIREVKRLPITNSDGDN